MNKLLLLVAFFFATPIFAETHKVCIPNLGGCLIAGGGGIWLSPPLFAKTDVQTKADFRKMGYVIAELNDSIESRLAPTISMSMTHTKSIEEIEEDLEALGDTFGESAVACAIGFAGCGGSSFVVAAQPWAFWLVKVTCVGVGAQCSYTIKHYERWEKKNLELQKKKKEERERSSRTGSIEGRGGPGAGGPTGRLSGPTGGLKCGTLPGGTVTAGGVTVDVPPEKICLPTGT